MEILFILAMCFLGGYLLSPLIFILIGNLAALLTLKRYEKMYEAYGRLVFGTIFEGEKANLKKQATQLNYLSKKKSLILKLFVYANLSNQTIRIAIWNNDTLLGHNTVSIFEDFLDLKTRSDISVFIEFEKMLRQARQFYRSIFVERTFLYRLWLDPYRLVKKN